ncbi:MAG: NYN domain-containing protein [Nostoc sp. DedQUE04]|uniref:NYN domain-containing protein n=1 Tax=Nostoc sp. DedQUE04 TaxID=3075390 RepID=UPI002AD29B03|nr:NYN domain-containing protein [Nostoc sp. DedQUE04]MDZ8139767.1 NYN domain-containing protein [Nostoc sp. DedQUE04]
MARQISLQQDLVSMYWDYQNISDPKIAKDLLLFASSLGFIAKQKVYSNWCKQSKAKLVLSNLDFDCIHVYQKFRNAVDFKLVMDCGGDSSDIVILISGDSFCEIVIDNLRRNGKKVIIFARPESAKLSLINLADMFYFVDDLPKLVENNNQFKSTSLYEKINYNEAIEYLLKAINTALDQKKRTGLGYINNLMMQLFTKYQGVCSIYVPDGKKFKSFSQFIDAAIRDGKVQKQGQELLLVELDKLAA